MIHIHPFPARMAPEIALQGLESLSDEAVVLDPMSGSGMVIGTAAKLGLQSIGYDLDPLACLISRANGTQVDPDRARMYCQQLLIMCKNTSSGEVKLPWIDLDKDTIDYIEFWFAPKQREQLRSLSYFLIEKPFISNRNYLDIIKVSVSRLIITKEPKASLARDTAHSRPHRTITHNEFDIFEALPSSLDHVLSALKPDKVLKMGKAYRGDARKMGRIADRSVDCIVTSPPYLNAIDYMRGHRLSLVWLGFSVAELRRIRSRSVGAEVVDKRPDCPELETFFSALGDGVDAKRRQILRRYYRDLRSLTSEAFRVLKEKSTATYVIGNSNIKSHEIRNSELLVSAAQQSGFQVIERYEREIPDNRRYMPFKNTSGSSLSKRMRSEHVIVFQK